MEWSLSAETCLLRYHDEGHVGQVLLADNKGVAGGRERADPLTRPWGTWCDAAEERKG